MLGGWKNRIPLSRRQLVAGGAAMIAVPGGHAFGRSRQAGSRREIASGCVFEDADGSGLHTRGTRGIPGVMVSNGRDVALTSGDGSWRLPVGTGDSVFVIKPAGWVLPQGDAGVPRFSHLHQPAGTPRHFGSRFAGVAGTGELPASIDFPLRREDEPARFGVLLVADTQPGNARELGFVRDSLLSQVPGTGTRFAIHHGDVMGDDLGLFERYVAMLRATGITWHHCPGNHDMNLDAGDPSLSFETWKRFFGPTHYAFQHAGATFIVLNNVEPLGPKGSTQSERGYRGMIGQRQLAFVGNVLRHVPDEHLVVVSMHIPLVSYEDPNNPADTTGDRRKLLEILARRPRTVSFAGHSHTTEHHYLGIEEGFGRTDPHHHHVLTAACGSWWSGPADPRGIPFADSRDGSPKGFHVLTVNGGDYATRFVSAADGAAAQMRIMLDCPTERDTAAPGGLPLSQISGRERRSARILANVFDGGPRTSVQLDIAGHSRACRQMERVDVCDPYIVAFFSQNQATCKPWVSASRSSHIWMCGLPDDIEPGVHRIAVKARSEYGHEHTGHLLIEVTA